MNNSVYFQISYTNIYKKEMNEKIIMIHEIQIKIEHNEIDVWKIIRKRKLRVQKNKKQKVSSKSIIKIEKSLKMSHWTDKLAIFKIFFIIQS